MVKPSRELLMVSVDWQPQVLESYRWEHPREGLRFPSAPLCVWHYAGTQAKSNPSSRCILLGSRGFLKIHVEMAFEEHTCLFSTLSQSPLLSYQAPSFCCLPGFSGQFCLWPFFYIQVTNIMKRFWIWTRQTRSPQWWLIVQVHLQAGGCLFFSQHCKMSDVYFSSLKSHRPLSECSQEVL